MFKDTLVFNSKETLFTGSHVADPVHYSVKIKILFDGSIKGLTDMITCTGGCHILTRQKRYSSGRKP